MIFQMAIPMCAMLAFASTTVFGCIWRENEGNRMKQVYLIVFDCICMYVIL